MMLNFLRNTSNFFASAPWIEPLKISWWEIYCTHSCKFYRKFSKIKHYLGLQYLLAMYTRLAICWRNMRLLLYQARTKLRCSVYGYRIVRKLVLLKKLSKNFLTNFPDGYIYYFWEPWASKNTSTCAQIHWLRTIPR